MTDTSIPTARCPSCDSENDHAHKISGQSDLRLPKPGSWVICAHCTAILRMTDDKQFRLATHDDLETLPTEALLQLAMSSAFIGGRLRVVTLDEESE